MWKDLKIFQVKHNVKSFNDLLVMLSLKLLTGETTITESYDVKKELDNYQSVSNGNSNDNYSSGSNNNDVGAHAS